LAFTSGKERGKKIYMKKGFKQNQFFALIVLGLILFLYLPISVVRADVVQTSVTVEVEEAPPPSGGGGGGVYIPPPLPTKVVLQGRAYPDSLITLLWDGQIATTVRADSQASFIIEIPDITPGIWSFSLWAEDSQGRRSITFTFTTTVPKGMTTTISNIFLPPTIDLDKDEVIRGQDISILGQTAPESNVSIYFYSTGGPIIKETKADRVGAYFYNFNTRPLEAGSHSTKAKSSFENGLVSGFSETLAFQVLPSEEAVVPEEKPKAILVNLNSDFDEKGNNIINLIDFSILFHNWGIPKNSKADMNKDGKVDIVDFSIMLYYWTG
jgi:hypothetical protein